MSSSAQPKRRLEQIEQHLVAAAGPQQQFSDVYILSASRTPTAKVREYESASGLFAELMLMATKPLD